MSKKKDSAQFLSRCCDTICHMCSVDTRLKPKVFSLSVSLLLLASCGEHDDLLPEYELSGPTMGTTFSVKLVAPPTDLDKRELLSRINSLLAGIESDMSTYRSDSEISRFNAHQAADWFAVSSESCGVVQEALALSKFTGGSFDITVGPLVNLWGFGPDGAVSVPPERQRVAAMIARVGYGHLHVDCTRPALRKDLPDLYVDLSAYAKGFAADRVAALLDDQQVDHYLVEIGGELRLHGSNRKGQNWAIAVEKPARMERTIQTVVGLTDSAMATSGDYRNYFEHNGKHYSHTIDPRTGYPVSHETASVTVIADTAAYADAMATALHVLGQDAGLEFAERENIAAYFLVRTDSGIEERMTTSFAARLQNK